MTHEQIAAQFAWLDALRESGMVNMHDSTLYLAQVFSLGASEARDSVLGWMETFDESLSPRTRAAIYMKGVREREEAC